jgi:hypothetical protein
LTRSDTCFVCLAAFALALSACSQSPVTVPLRSLEASGNVSFVCAALAPNGTLEGKDINDCPDYANGEDRLFALVTQTGSGEVAVIDLTTGTVVDTDPSTPGFNFLPIGANPTDIVSTPGGVASFVGVAEVGKEGIYALPSSCIGPPQRLPSGQEETVRDLTTWPACSLPSAPGAMTILIDPPIDTDGNPATPPELRASCDSAPSAAAGTPGTAVAATRTQCAADLALETDPPGRRKLAVALPKLGAIAIIDAQELLDRQPGSFAPCKVERWVRPQVDLPASFPPQRIPSDLKPPAGCQLPQLNYGPPKQSYVAWPSDFALSDKVLYVSDHDAPVVHRFDVSDPCAIHEQPPLLTASYEEPGRVVTTSKVAVSPLTTKGQRFVYAIDEAEGSVMIFDVSPGSTDRTPILRRNSARLPFEAPDRIAFTSPASDVAFALHDTPIPDPATGVAVVGTACNPDPSISTTSVGALYRPASDFSSGAAPRNLRGIFGFVLLTSGQIAVTDVEDFDAACRRPEDVNHSATPDFRGCANDPKNVSTYAISTTGSDQPTVTNEVSCNVVEQNRTRSANFVADTSQTGNAAPSLRSFLVLRQANGSNASAADPQYPKMLGVDFSDAKGEEAQVFVGSTLYDNQDGADNPLVVDPSTATEDSIVLPLVEPRAYNATENYTATYEGPIMGARESGALELTTDRLDDADASFCGLGVQDADAAKAVGAELGAKNPTAFGKAHADYVQLLTDVPASDDPYWHSAAAQACGGSTAGYYNCSGAFGTPDEPQTNRDLTILQAYQDHLVVQLRAPGKGVDLNLLRCCFPSAQTYTVRGGSQWIVIGSSSGFRNHMIADSTGRCVADCNPRRALLNGRAYEIGTKETECVQRKDKSYDCSAAACLVDPLQGAATGNPGWPCVFNSLSARFAVYGGTSPSERDMQFSWTVEGGFSPLVANLTSETAAVLPQSMVFVPQINQLAVADGAAEGLALVSLNTVGVANLYY